MQGNPICDFALTSDGQTTVGSNNANIRVVGIGASAGGIEALNRFFDVMPADSGCAFVVVLHLDPNRESELAHILSVHTTMPVLQVENGMRIAPDHVYVIAPDSNLRVRDGLLHLSRPTVPRGHGHPVDVLFQSLAADQHQGAIAIVLSGTGSNGTEGLKEIRAQGGMSIVQTPATAEFDGMPRSAIMADMADHILAPEDMPATIIAYVGHGYVSGRDQPQNVLPKKEVTLDHILDLLRAHGGHDFRGYKHSTLKRRVHRRLGLKNIETLDEYLKELRVSPDEVSALALDLMISVTGFFRDPEAWKVLTELVIVPTLTERENDASIRIWVPACSTGEEAYSIAMLITEQAELLGKRFDLKVFATDAQEVNLRHARDGIYPDAAVDEFPAPRLKRFFEKLEGTWQVNKELRGMVVFAPQNLLRDPPFSRLDLISCRNVLIYLEPEAQQKIISICHFALSPGAHLFLGNAETIGRHEDLFDAISKKWRIYRRMGTTPHAKIDYALQLGLTEPRVLKPSAPFADTNNSVAEMARRALLDQYAPASVLIDRKARVLYFHGETGDYLQQPTGEPTRDLLTMARDGLIVKLRLAIREALSEKLHGCGRARPVNPSRSMSRLCPHPGRHRARTASLW
jgi:two-component system CheB/CheR fusion protein